MPLSIIKDVLEKNGCSVSVSGSSITIEYGGVNVSLDVDDNWKKEIRSYERSNQYDFEAHARKLIGPKSFEIGVSRLSQEFIIRPNHKFTSPKKRVVVLSPCSNRFALYFFNSDEYKVFFEAVVLRKLKRERIRNFKDLFWFPPTITFSVPRKIDRSKLLAEAMPALEACLFKLAVERGECWDFLKKRKQKLRAVYDEPEDEEMLIPLASYDSNMLKYYKVAISSQFPSQSFLAFYHVLEYNFLKVSDEALHGRLKSHIHSTSFSGTDEQLEKVINIVKKHNDRSDEAEMLMRVLRKYIDEEELIEFISDIEKQAEDKLYTKSIEVFGERFQVQNKKDHAISNVAKILKHVRNALVHSSDRYNRDDCHIPLTESEYIVENYVPLIRFLAEKVIYAKSS